MNTNSVSSRDLPVKLGGKACVTIPEPHFSWPLPDPEAEKAVIEMMQKAELSYFRLEGKVQAFEEAYRAQMGLPYSITTHSGTGALHAGWFGLNLPPGSEVIVPAYTHIGTVMPLFHLGLIPILCDVDPTSGNIDPQAIPALITNRTSAIGVTHQFGLSVRMDEVMEIAQNHNLQVLEDCSHAHGSFYCGKPVGSLGDVACFSLQAHKTVPVGEGGILLTSNANIAERASLLGNFRQHREFSSGELASLVETGYGMKSRLHPLAAAIGEVALRKMPEIIAQRRANYQLLTELVDPIPGLSVLNTPEDSDRGGYFRFVLQVDADNFAGMNAEQVVMLAQEEGAIEARPGALARCLQSFKVFQDNSISIYTKKWIQGSDPLADRPEYKLGDFPYAEAFSARTIQLPAFTLPCEQLLAEYIMAFAKIQAHAEVLVEQSYNQDL